VPARLVSLGCTADPAVKTAGHVPATVSDSEPPTFRTADGRSVPAVTADEMRAVDRIAVEETGPELLQMMENAGRTLAAHALELATAGDTVVVLAGGGGNGGGGLCAARHLHDHDHGHGVSVLIDRPPADLEGAAATQRDVLGATPVDLCGPDDWSAAAPLEAVDGPATVVDAVVGYGLTESLRGTAADLIRACDASGAARVVSLDVPTGVNATTGERPGAAVRPDRTLTLALPKTGLAAVGGDLHLADIGIPPAVFERAGVDYRRPFDGEWSVPLRRPE